MTPNEAYASLVLDVIKANLASLNEIVNELISGLSQDPTFVQLAHDTLRDANWLLGYDFNDQKPEADDLIRLASMIDRTRHDSTS